MEEKPIAKGLVGLLVIFAIGFVAGCATYPSTSGRVVVHDKNTHVEVAFSDRDRSLIRKYYRRHHLPPGLAKRSSLPPGLQKQVQRRGQLPPGLRGNHLPHELEVQLSSLPEGYVRLRVGVDVVLMNTHTRVIVDVVKDI
ncbi:MAG: hypothetical protein ACE5MM_03055 [Nitrospiraceae bacterium]